MLDLLAAAHFTMDGGDRKSIVDCPAIKERELTAAIHPGSNGLMAILPPLARQPGDTPVAGSLAAQLAIDTKQRDQRRRRSGHHDARHRQDDCHFNQCLPRTVIAHGRGSSLNFQMVSSTGSTSCSAAFCQVMRS
jgi:hypothetical protein